MLFFLQMLSYQKLNQHIWEEGSWRISIETYFPKTLFVLIYIDDIKRRY